MVSMNTYDQYEHLGSTAFVSLQNPLICSQRPNSSPRPPPFTFTQADGIIINRGTLGLDVLPEKMAMVQKTLIKV